MSSYLKPQFLLRTIWKGADCKISINCECFPACRQLSQIIMKYPPVPPLFSLKSPCFQRDYICFIFRNALTAGVLCVKNTRSITILLLFFSRDLSLFSKIVQGFLVSGASLSMLEICKNNRGDKGAALKALSLIKPTASLMIGLISALFCFFGSPLWNYHMINDYKAFNISDINVESKSLFSISQHTYCLHLLHIFSFISWFTSSTSAENRPEIRKICQST